MLRLWEKVRQSGGGLLSEMRWVVLRQHRFPCLEQVSCLEADLRKEARQALEGDRENRMTTWKIGFARTTEMLVIGANGSTMNKL